MANVSRWFDRNRGAALAPRLGRPAVAGAVWPPLFQYTIDGWGWRTTLFWYGVFVFASMLPLALLIRRPPAAAPEAQAREPVSGTTIVGLPAISCRG